VEELLSLELKTALETLWQPLYEGQALGLHLGEEEGEEEAVEEAVEGEEAEVEDNQLLSLYNNFTNTFKQQFTDSMKVQCSRQQLERLRFKFPDINQYIADFEDLANLSGYTIRNNETINLFLKGFEHARDLLGGILALPMLTTYYKLKDRAINVTKS